MATTYGGEHDPGLIEDVVTPVGPSGFDVRLQSVRRQSIGALEQQYLHIRAAYTPTKEYKLPSSDVFVRPKVSYTRVPPLGSFSSLGRGYNLTSFKEFIGARLGTASHKARLGWNYLKKLGGLGLAYLAVTVSRIKALKMPSRPQKYHFSKGTYNERGQQAPFVTKRLIPTLAIIAIVLLLFLLPASSPRLKNNPGTSNGGNSQNLPTSGSAQQTSSTTSGNGRNGNGSGSAGASGSAAGGSAASSSSPNTAGVSVPSVSTTLPSAGGGSIPVGGMGGGSSLPSTPTTSPSPGSSGSGGSSLPLPLPDPVSQVIQPVTQPVTQAVDNVAGSLPTGGGSGSGGLGL